MYTGPVLNVSTGKMKLQRGMPKVCAKYQLSLMYIWHVFLIYFVVLFKISSALFQGEFMKIRLLSSIYQRPIGDRHALLETYMLHRTPTCLIRHWSKTNMLNQVFPISIQWGMSVANEACRSPMRHVSLR